MSPLIRHLNETFIELSLLEAEQSLFNGTFTKKIKNLGPEFYRKIMPFHLVLNLEYSLLCGQIRNKFLSKQSINQKEIVDQLIAALILAEFLEHIYQCYLIVPREVVRLQQQREQLNKVIQIFHSNQIKQISAVPSFTQYVRTTTINVNMYRLLLIRSKRALDLIALFNTSSEAYLKFVKVLDKLTDPILAHLAWCFYLPRLFVNLSLMIKHIVPGFWMDNEERSLGWSVRFKAQMQRRWFELGNDLAWVSVGLINCFILTGALAPIATYLTISCFFYDVILAAARAYIELNRLYELQKQYKKMSLQSTNTEEKKQAEDYLKAIDNQLNFELLRLGSHVTNTIAVFLSMCCAAPLFAAFPIIPLMGAILLVSICFINFGLVETINKSRPKDEFKIPSNITKLGIFSQHEKLTTESKFQIY
ncbi:MAG: hypothetical protein HYX60_09290, partial [Legionella longbeachae]|nr:hypothetical protein [Legionella longbeachae]